MNKTVLKFKADDILEITITNEDIRPMPWLSTDDLLEISQYFDFKKDLSDEQKEDYVQQYLFEHYVVKNESIDISKFYNQTIGHNDLELFYDGIAEIELPNDKGAVQVDLWYHTTELYDNKEAIEIYEEKSGEIFRAYETDEEE